MNARIGSCEHLGDIVLQAVETRHSPKTFGFFGLDRLCARCVELGGAMLAPVFTRGETSVQSADLSVHAWPIWVFIQNEIRNLGERQFKFLCSRGPHDDLVHHGAQDSISMSVRNVAGRTAYRVRFVEKT